MTALLPPPLGGPAPDEEPLANSPLVKVVVQARFSSVLKIDSKEGVAPLQEALRKHYPLLEQVASHELQIEVGSSAPSFRPIVSNVWRFSDANKYFIVSLTSDAITLETHNYPGRDLFMERWAQLLRWVEDIYAPGLVVRMGIRYLNRIDGEAVGNLPDWIAPNLIGVALPEFREHVRQAISEANLNVEEGAMLLRWGILPPGVTIDPGLLEPAQTPSWLLDIDVYSSSQRSFDAEGLATIYKRMSERAYAAFRWVMTPSGLAHFKVA
ncbi:TIGR04255 family protein [Xanthobacter autotrophicus]|uniref:TIGR04255 family protein n=1 Tax=Xanthobacter autotrophicus TaxID=280 RepID=UPI0024A64FD7|nr:TIGR04255 family protein [Xanthobacter autotrophicus]MDI4655518.1 TIGR04255 family protein [Xanthobacter autotrophicus]